MHYHVSLERFVESFVSYLKTSTTVSHVDVESMSGNVKFWCRDRPSEEESFCFQSGAGVFFTPFGDVKLKIEFRNKSPETVETVSMRIFEEYMLEINPATEYGTASGLYEFRETCETVTSENEQGLFKRIYERAQATAERMYANSDLVGLACQRKKEEIPV